MSEKNGEGSRISPQNSKSTKKEVFSIVDCVSHDHPYSQNYNSYLSSRNKSHPIRYILSPPPQDHCPPSRTETPCKSPRLEALLRQPSKINNVNRPYIGSPSPSPNEDDGEIDVESIPPSRSIPYDEEKARSLMDECSNHVKFMKQTDGPDNWEEQIVKTGWTKTQCSLFKQTMKILRSEYLARLAYTDNYAEPILRRNTLDMTTARFRVLLTSVNWDTKLTQWLHGVLVDYLNCDYLSSYLDILQTLRAKCTTLVDKMIILSTSVYSESSVDSQDPSEALKKRLNAEALSLLLKRQWDPFLPLNNSQRLKKLPFNPIFILLPSGPAYGSAVNPRRGKTFSTMLSNLGKVLTVVGLSTNNMNCLSINEYSYKMYQAAKAKINEIRASNPEKPIFLLGWGVGALLASKLSLEDIDISGVISLGFPLINLTNKIGDTDDPLLDMKIPILFVIGERACNNSITDMELFRKELICENTLVVVRCGDDHLQVGPYHRQKLRITQSFVDRSIVDEIRMFVNGVMLPTPTGPPEKRQRLKSVYKSKKASKVPPQGSYQAPLPSHKHLTSSSTSSKNPQGLLPNILNGNLKPLTSDSYNSKFNPLLGETFEENFDCQKFIPSNVSTSKRKAYYKPAPQYPPNTTQCQPTRSLESPPVLPTTSTTVPGPTTTSYSIGVPSSSSEAPPSTHIVPPPTQSPSNSTITASQLLSQQQRDPVRRLSAQHSLPPTTSAVPLKSLQGEPSPTSNSLSFSMALTNNFTTSQLLTHNPGRRYLLGPCSTATSTATENILSTLNTSSGASHILIQTIPRPSLVQHTSSPSSLPMGETTQGILLNTAESFTIGKSLFLSQQSLPTEPAARNIIIQNLQNRQFHHSSPSPLPSKTHLIGAPLENTNMTEKSIDAPLPPPTIGSIASIANTPHSINQTKDQPVPIAPIASSPSPVPISMQSQPPSTETDTTQRLIDFDSMPKLVPVVTSPSRTLTLQSNMAGDASKLSREMKSSINEDKLTPDTMSLLNKRSWDSDLTIGIQKWPQPSIQQEKEIKKPIPVSTSSGTPTEGAEAAMPIPTSSTTPSDTPVPGPIETPKALPVVKEIEAPIKVKPRDETPTPTRCKTPSPPPEVTLRTPISMQDAVKTVFTNVVFSDDDKHPLPPLPPPPVQILSKPQKQGVKRKLNENKSIPCTTSSSTSSSIPKESLPKLDLPPTPEVTTASVLPKESLQLELSKPPTPPAPEVASGNAKPVENNLHKLRRSNAIPIDSSDPPPPEPKENGKLKEKPSKEIKPPPAKKLRQDPSMTLKDLFTEEANRMKITPRESMLPPSPTTFTSTPVSNHSGGNKRNSSIKSIKKRSGGGTEDNNKERVKKETRSSVKNNNNKPKVNGNDMNLLNLNTPSPTPSSDSDSAVKKSRKRKTYEKATLRNLRSRTSDVSGSSSFTEMKELEPPEPEKPKPESEKEEEEEEKVVEEEEEAKPRVTRSRSRYVTA